MKLNCIFALYCHGHASLSPCDRIAIYGWENILLRVVPAHCVPAQVNLFSVASPTSKQQVAMSRRTSSASGQPVQLSHKYVRFASTVENVLNTRTRQYVKSCDESSPKVGRK